MIDRGKELLYTAISLARMYGIGECLNDIPFIQQGKMNDMIVNWAEEYMKTGENDLVDFFEYKIKNITNEKPE